MTEIWRLVVAPHADDESLGCGGVMAMDPEHTAVLVLSEPDGERADEFETAMRIIGVPDGHRIIGGLADGSIGSDPRLPVNLIDEAMRIWQPLELLLPWPSSHQDHVATYEAGVRAARLSCADDHWSPRLVMAYQVPVYSTDLRTYPLNWNVVEEISSTAASVKAQAVTAYKSQIGGTPHPIGFQEVLAHARAAGASRGLEYGEPYALVRWTK